MKEDKAKDQEGEKENIPRVLVGVTYQWALTNPKRNKQKRRERDMRGNTKNNSFFILTFYSLFYLPPLTYGLHVIHFCAKLHARDEKGDKRAKTKRKGRYGRRTREFLSISSYLFHFIVFSFLSA